MAERYTKRKMSLIFNEAPERVFVPERKFSKLSLSSRKNSNFSEKSDGIRNVAFSLGTEYDGARKDTLSEVHIGHSNAIRRKSISYLKKELEIDYHIVDLEILCERFGTDLILGLEGGQVEKNRERFGANALTPPKKQPLILTFLYTLCGGFQLLLWVASLLSFIAYIVQYEKEQHAPLDNLYLGIALSVLVLLLGLFTFYQEYSSGKVMDSFAKMVPTLATVTRDGKVQQIPASELVVGDIVEVKLGDSIPADIRIIKSQGLKVDNSSLTGESEPQPRSPTCTDDNPMETKNLAFFSTNALDGAAQGLVVAVGDGTFIGRIAGLATGMDSIETPMAIEVRYFVKVISFVAVFFGVTFFAISLVMGYTIIDGAIFLVGIIVANVPEGLLVTFTVILALTAKRMATKNCVVRQLHAVETLGSCSVICSDKTGTLTQNKMSVSHVWVGNKVEDVGGGGGSRAPRSFEGFPQLARVASLCSRAKFLDGQEALPIAQRAVNGDASESAILRFMEASQGNVESFQSQNPKIFEIPFNSTNKWQLSIHRMEIGSGSLVVLKGAPERVINLCSKIRLGGDMSDVHNLDGKWKYAIEQVVEDLGALGERVIGFCEAELPVQDYPMDYQYNVEDLSFLDGRLVLVGLISMIDPPRPEVPQAVELCRRAGIKVVMVTGDHPTTARAIARKVGIISPDNFTKEERARELRVRPEEIDEATCDAIVVPGAMLQELSTPELDYILRDYSEIVFARVSPQQKLVIVEGFQRLGKIVAVTGDGVNDSPALKKADIGIAMGISGSDVSKQAADMILLDDNFSSIVTGIEEGRLIFENLKKCIRYLLCANTANLLPFLLYITLDIPLPLGTIQMLAITLGTDILPTISLSYEKPEGDIMARQPRNPKTDKLVTQQLISYAYGFIGIIEAASGLFTYVVIMAENGFRPRRLLGIRGAWDSRYNNDLEDSYGQEWSYEQRKDLEKTCWTAYFCTIVLCQWANLFISKVRRDPLHRKFFDNWIVFVAIVGETGIAALLTYTPGLNHAISYMSIKFNWWLPAIPFMACIICFDEVRRLFLRIKPKWGWYQNEFYY